jgi:adenylosuccinate synthase
MINGTNQMALTKLDWLPRFGDEISVCVAYVREGQTIDIAPDASYKLEQCSPVYKKLPNWKEDISGIRKFKDLPINARNFIRFVEKQTGVPVVMVGVGPKRDQVIEMH